jgi:predicted RNA-binding protein Jag
MSDKKGIFSFLSNWSEKDSSENEGSKDATTTTTKENQSSRPAVVITDEIEAFAVEKTQELLKLSQFQGDVSPRYKKGYTLCIEISNAGDDLGRIIGKNGSCLQALQILIKFFIIRKFEISLRVVVDAGDYKNRHQSQMKRMALKAADEVITSGNNIKLDPMNAVDRRTIHVLFENHNDIITQSEGEGDERHIVLMKRDDAK